MCSAGDTLTPEQCRVLVRDSCMQLVVYVCIYILYTHMHVIVRSSGLKGREWTPKLLRNINIGIAKELCVQENAVISSECVLLYSER